MTSTTFPKNFAPGDRVRAFYGNGNGGFEEWTTVVAQHDEDSFVVKAESFRGIDQYPNSVIHQIAQSMKTHGYLFETDGVLQAVVGVDHLKSEAQGNYERSQYLLEEEEEAGLD